MSRAARGRRGFALFLSLLFLLVLTISGIALMFNTSVEDTIAGVETKVSKTFYAADSGVEYAGAALQSNSPIRNGTGVDYVGGKLAQGLSSNYPTAGGSPPKDIDVTVSAPVKLGTVIRPGDEIVPQDKPQLVEQIYGVSSTATSTTLQSSKTINVQFSVYPWYTTVN